MRGNISIRAVIAAVLILLTYLGVRVVAKLTESPPGVLPNWNLKDLSMQLGDWKGTDVELDKRLFEAEGSQSVVERQYRNGSGMSVALHIAMFTDATTGIWHTPTNCYVTGGWAQKDSGKVPLSESDDNSDKMAFSSWEKSGERTLVGYWFQLGENRLYGRWDLGFNIRWQMRGRKTWPALIKVLLSAPSGVKEDENKAQLIKFADLVHKWINLPEHQTAEESDPAAAAAAKASAQ
jgi:EpsI family protein